jgi:hypothetical protein
VRARGVGVGLSAAAAVLLAALVPASGSPGAAGASATSNKATVVRAIATSTSAKTLEMQATSTVNVDGMTITSIINGGVILSPFTASFREHVSTNDGSKPRTIPVVITKDRVYLQLPARATDLPQWYDVPTSQAIGSVGTDGSASYDFGLTLGLHPGSISKVRIIGHKTIGGRPTTEFFESVDVAKELGGQTDGNKLGDSALGRFAQESGTQTVSEEVWVDQTHHVRMAMLSYPLAGSYLKKLGLGKDAFGSYQLSETFSDFGVGLFIVPPPAAEVLPLPSALQGAAGGLGVST